MGNGDAIRDLEVRIGALREAVAWIAGDSADEALAACGAIHRSIQQLHALLLQQTAEAHERLVREDEPVTYRGNDAIRFTGDRIAEQIGANPQYGFELVELSLQAKERLAPAREALSHGELDFYKFRLIAEKCQHLDDESTTAVQTKILPGAGERSSTSFRRSLRYYVAKIDPRTAEQQRKAATAERRLEFIPKDDGQATLILHGPADVLRAITDRCGAVARTISDDDRTHENIRFDVATDFLLTGIIDAPRRTTFVNVHVELATLLGLDDNPAELDGYGMITAEAARELAKDENACFRRITTLRGQVTSVTQCYRPTRKQRALAQFRHRTCVFPGCNHPSTSADLDHGNPYRRTKNTDLANLSPFCRRHHRYKHLGLFSWRRRDGNLIEIRYRSGTERSIQPEPILRA